MNLCFNKVHVQIVKMALMVIARYNFIFTRPRMVCSTKLGAMFRGLLFSVIMLQVFQI